MATFLITFFVLLLVVAAMAVGVLAGRRPLNGSCGGLNNVDGLEQACPICADPAACEKG